MKSLGGAHKLLPIVISASCVALILLLHIMLSGTDLSPLAIYLIDLICILVLSPLGVLLSERLEQTGSSNHNRRRYDNHPKLSSLAVPALAITPDNHIIFANSAASAYFGAESLDGIDLFQILSLSFVVGEGTLTDWLRSCRFGDTRGISQSWERVRHELPSGGYREFDMVAHYTPDSDDEYEVVLIFIDHTARYTREDKDVGYVALAVHELRTPLTVMRGYIEVFNDEVRSSLNSEKQAFMDNLNAQAETLTDFVSSILDVARIEENQLHVRLREEDWPTIIQKAVSDMELRAKVRNVRLQLELGEGLGKATVDRVSVYEIMNNLIDNAIKYTHTDEVVIIRSFLKDANTIETSITDHGVGIPEDVIPHLFKKFYRSHSSRNVAVGTGIGLYLCKALVTAHGGDIKVTSAKGKGTTFSFTLPLDQPIAKGEEIIDNGIKRTAHGWIKDSSNN